MQVVLQLYLELQRQERELDLKCVPSSSPLTFSRGDHSFPLKAPTFSFLHLFTQKHLSSNLEEDMKINQNRF